MFTYSTNTNNLFRSNSLKRHLCPKSSAAFAMSDPTLQCQIPTPLSRHVFESYFRDVFSNSTFHDSFYKTKTFLLLLLLLVYACFILTLAGKAFALTLLYFT